MAGLYRRIEMFDTVRLKDGRRASIMEVLGDQEAFIVDVGSSPKDWETIDIHFEDIEEIVENE